MQAEVNSLDTEIIEECDEIGVGTGATLSNGHQKGSKSKAVKLDMFPQSTDSSASASTPVVPLQSIPCPPPLSGSQLSPYPPSGESAPLGTEDETVALDQLLTHIDREIILKRSCKAIPFGFFFYVCFVWSAWLKCDVYNYGLGSSFVDMFDNIPVHKWGRLKYRKAGDRIQSSDDLLEYIVDGVVPLLWAEQHGRIRKHHKIVGGLRMKQERAHLVKCAEERLSTWYTPSTCRDSDETSAEPYSNYTDDTAFRSDENGLFNVLLPIERPAVDIQNRVLELWEKGWVDYSTQVVILELAIYNGEVDAWAHTNVIFEFHSSGNVQHFLKVSTANNLFKRWYYFVADLCVWSCLIYLAFEEARLVISKIRERKFFSQYIQGTEAYWKLGEWAAIVLGITGLSGHVFIQGQVSTLAKDMVQNPQTWEQTLDRLADVVAFKKQHEVVLFFFAVAIMIRFFKVFDGQPRLAVMSMTFGLCCTDLLYFFVIFMVIFSVTSFLLFNSQLKPWRSIFLSFNECFKILMEDYPFAAMFRVHPFAASLWFWLFMTLVYIVVVNMLIAVILDTYTHAKELLGQDTQKGFVTQLHHLWLQSRACKVIKERSGESGWESLEDLRERLIKLEEQYVMSTGGTTINRASVPPALAKMRSNAQSRTSLKSLQESVGLPFNMPGRSRISLAGSYAINSITPSIANTAHLDFGISIQSLMELGAPEDQAEFLWKIVAQECGIGASDKRKESVSSIDEDEETDSCFLESYEYEEEDVTETFQQYEERMDRHETALRAGLSEIMFRLSDIDAVRKASLQERAALPGAAT